MTWRTVVLPREHGGWSLIAEPALLGLLVAPSWAGVALAFAGVLAFLARTPLRLFLVDRSRHRWLPRTSLAWNVALVELALAALLATMAWARAGSGWLVAVGVAAPLVAVQLWFDARSRSRRLAPELAGSVAAGAFAAAVALAGGAPAALAAGLWLVLAGRSIAAIPFVRVQIARWRGGSTGANGGGSARAAGIVGVIVALVAVALDMRLALGAAVVMAAVGLHAWWVRRPPSPAKVVGLQQLALGLALVATTAAGMLVL
jgi:YwiC-like protein